MHNLDGPVLASGIATLSDLKEKLVADRFSEDARSMWRPATRAATIANMTSRPKHIFAGN